MWSCVFLKSAIDMYVDIQRVQFQAKNSNLFQQLKKTWIEEVNYTMKNKLRIVFQSHVLNLKSLIFTGSSMQQRVGRM